MLKQITSQEAKDWYEAIDSHWQNFDTSLDDLLKDYCISQPERKLLVEHWQALRYNQSSPD
jgi:hypothetical protein